MVPSLGAIQKSVHFPEDITSRGEILRRRDIVVSLSSVQASSLENCYDLPHDVIWGALIPQPFLIFTAPWLEKERRLFKLDAALL